MQDIHDIHPPVQTGTDPVLFWGILGGIVLVLLVLLAVFLFLKWKKRKGRERIKTVEAQITAFDAAMRDLQSLKNEPPADLRRFYFELSRILRQYLGERFHMHCAEMTSAEFFLAMKQMPLDTESKNRIRSFFLEADPVRYAGMVPVKDQAEASLSRVTDLISRVEEN